MTNSIINELKIDRDKSCCSLDNILFERTINNIKEYNNRNLYCIEYDIKSDFKYKFDNRLNNITNEQINDLIIKLKSEQIYAKYIKSSDKLYLYWKYVSYTENKKVHTNKIIKKIYQFILCLLFLYILYKIFGVIAIFIFLIILAIIA